MPVRLSVVHENVRDTTLRVLLKRVSETAFPNKLRPCFDGKGSPLRLGVLAGSIDMTLKQTRQALGFDLSQAEPWHSAVSRGQQRLGRRPCLRHDAIQARLDVWTPRAQRPNSSGVKYR